MKKKAFYCSECGAKYLKWAGRCSQCENWDTLTEETEPDTPSVVLNQGNQARALAEIVNENVKTRWVTEVEQFDRVMGGGVVPASIGLLGGAPGVGKSTLILQLMSRMGKLGLKVLYVSGEESEAQVKMRSERLKIAEENIYLLSTSDVDVTLAHMADLKADFVVVDSIQTLSTSRFPSGAGSIVQVRETATMLQKYAKTHGAAVLLIGHVTKDGFVAGPKTLEHLVDYVIYLEMALDPTYRYMHPVKNRFGALNEIGLFKMTSRGLSEVKNPNSMLQTSLKEPAPGLAYFPSAEGGRTFIMEVQSLVGREIRSIPVRQCNGVERSRLMMLLAVLERHADTRLGSLDVYVNIAGGLKSVESSVDMALVSAVLTSAHGLTPPMPTLYIGEVSLTGKFYLYADGHERIAEGVQVGFRRIVIPASVPTPTLPGVQAEILHVAGVADLKRLLAGK